MNDIDVYRIGLGKDLHAFRVGLTSLRSTVRKIRAGCRQRSYWGIWQAESLVVEVNAARGLTARAAARRLRTRIARDL